MHQQHQLATHPGRGIGVPVTCPRTRTLRRPQSAAAASTTTHRAAAQPVLVQDGVLVAAPPATAQELLSQRRGWSYTTALVRQQHVVVDWELHIQRLIRNMELLARQRPPSYAGFAAWQQQQQTQDAVGAALQQLVNPMVATALQQLHDNNTSGAAPADDQEQAMLTVALGDQQSPPAAAAGSVPLSVLVWAKPVPAAAAAQPAKVVVAGGPRPAAQAKHCDWVVDRQPLEQLKQQAGADEVVLSDSSSGALLEGLVSNFYVVADAAQLAALGQPVVVEDVVAGGSAAAGQQQQQRGSAAPLSGLVLLTTGPDAHDALLGVTQQRVLQACQEVQLPVVLQPATASTAAAWKEAFLTNCLKGVQPVQEVQLPDGTAVWTAPAAPATATTALQGALASLQTETDARDWLLL